MEGKPFLRVPEAYREKLRDQMVNFISSQMSCEFASAQRNAL
jgi:hypothetical protein